MARRPSPSSDDAPTEKIDRSVTAVERTLTILDAFLQHPGPMKLRDIEAATGLFHSVILRYLISFERRRYIHRRPDGAYQLGSRIHQLGQAFERSFDLSVYVQPVLERLSAHSGESVSFYVAEDGKRVCLYRHEPVQTLKVSMSATTLLLPMDMTSTARVLFEFGARPAWREHPADLLVRKSSGIHDPWTASISTPVFNGDQQLVGALTISGPHFRFDIHNADMQRFLLDQAVALSAQLGCLEDVPAFSPARDPIQADT